MTDAQEVPDEDPDRTVTAFPQLPLPEQVASIAGAAVIISAGLAVLTGAISAATYRFPILGGVPAPSPAFTGADRLYLFTRSANLPVALLLLVGVVATSLRREIGPWPVAAVVAGVVLAAVVAIGNVANAWAVDTHAQGRLVGTVNANRLGTVVGLLAPVAICVGVVYFGLERLRSHWSTGEPAAEAQED